MQHVEAIIVHLYINTVSIDSQRVHWLSRPTDMYVSTDLYFTGILLSFFFSSRTRRAR